MYWQYLFGALPVKTSEDFGWQGDPPKSSAVLTIPVPKYCCQYWFTATRAVSGFEGSRIHFASPKRLGGRSRDIGGKNAGTPGMTFSPLSSYCPRPSTNVSRGFDISAMTMVVVIDFSSLSRSFLSSANRE